jgi:hypothetical protein
VKNEEIYISLTKHFEFAEIESILGIDLAENRMNFSEREKMMANYLILNCIMVEGHILPGINFFN